MWTSINQALNIIDNFVWGVPLMVLIIAGGLLLTIRLGLLQIRKLPLALKWMLQNEEGGKGEISSFSALCTALSATIGTGNIVGVATAVCAGGPGALFWMGLLALGAALALAGRDVFRMPLSLELEGGSGRVRWPIPTTIFRSRRAT